MNNKRLSKRRVDKLLKRIYKIQHRNKKFDFYHKLCYNISERMENNKMFTKTIREIVRLLEPGAHMYVYCMSASIIDEFCYRLLVVIPWRWYREDR